MKERPEFLDQPVLDEIEALRTREWDLMEQLMAARLRRAQLMNVIQFRREGRHDVAEAILNREVET